MPNESKVQLLTERALKALLVSYNIFPAEFPIYCAHEVATRDEARPDYLDLIAGIPAFPHGSWSLTVTLQLLTGIVDEAARATQTELHAQRLGDLRNLFEADENFETALATLNAPIEAGLKFNGWETVQGEPDDDALAQGNTQMVTRPKYLFDVYLV